ncbi:MAG TPA: hypothetical protein VEQ15_15330 [Myxococcales bacterium]|nr:hypothetical protein [Myxococcales bacterium]
MSRSLAAVMISAAAGLAVGLACAGAGNNRKGIKDACTRNLDCAYGLECVDESGAPMAAAGEDAGRGKARTCQWKSFGDCDVSESADGGTTPTAAQGGQQCLAGYKCREGKCTVMCAGNKDCREGETCKIGICQRQSGGQLAQCFDNRDCPWPETCYYGQCVTRTEGVRCQSDLDCHAGFRCINGICQ